MKKVLRFLGFLVFVFCLFNFNSVAAREDENRGKVSTAFVFGALSNACAQVGQIVGAETQKEKQQGALNLLSTAFAVVSQASDKEDKNKSIISKNDMVNSLNDLLLSTIDFMEEEMRTEEFSLLAEFKNLKTEEEQASFVEQLVLVDQKVKTVLKEVMHFLIDWLIDSC